MIKSVFLDEALRHYAETTPQNCALDLLGDTTSYADLNNLADRIANRLIASGVGRGDRVIVCAAKSLNAIAAIYAILRVGAVYVPVDPAAPPERMLLQTQVVAPKFIVTDSARYAFYVDHFAPAQILNISQELTAAPPSEAVRERRAQRAVDDPAYILMTSGSTGAPKGIVHTHKSALAYATMAANLCELHSADRVSNHTPLHFDMSTFDIFSTVLAGACVVIIPEMHTKLPASLSRLTEESRITVWYSVPFALTQMVERGALEDRDLSTLRIVMFAGEKMPPATLRSFSDYTPNARFLNAYGPTETNHCTTAEFSHSDLDGVSALPIGAPVDGVAARIGEDRIEAGTGELLIATDQLMREYWRNTEQTKSAFLELPDNQGVIRRFYRTGDIVSRTNNGQFKLIGRKDRQVKLRGFRIELDEVELALMNSATVSEAAVVVVGQNIHGFVTGESEDHLPEIRARIQSVLPHYAVPYSLEWLDTMPRTSTGKIDRTNLTERAHAQHAA